MSGCVRLGIALKKKNTKGCEGDVFKYLVSINFICILSIYILLGAVLNRIWVYTLYVY